MIKTKKVRLPSEYQEVEYIESSLKQMISTGVLIDLESTVIIESDVVFGAKTSGGYDYYMGYEPGRTSASYKNFYGFYNVDATHFGFGFGANSVTNLPTLIDNTKHTVKQTFVTSTRGGAATAEVLVDGNVWAQISTTFNTYQGTPRVALFGTGASGSEVLSPSRMKLYNFKATVNNVLIRDMVPCYRKSDNKAGLYDLVNNVFYSNPLSANFNKGSNVVPIKEVKKIMTKVNNVMKEVEYIKLKNPYSLPDTYQGVEYIESTGYQYIQTGYIPKQNTKIYVKMSPTSSSGFGQFPMMFGTQNTQYGNSGTFAMYYNSNYTVNARTGLNATNIKNSECSCRKYI